MIIINIIVSNMRVEIDRKIVITLNPIRKQISFVSQIRTKCLFDVIQSVT